MSEVREWLEAIGLVQYADAFEANDIDIDLLGQVDDQMLKDDAERSVRAGLELIFMGLRIAKIHEHTVAHVFRYEPAVTAHRLGDTLLVARDDLAQVLRVHTRRECCRADEVREHHCDLAALGEILCFGLRCSARSVLVLRDRACRA
jgi:SAM domain (Sterile alpha motif)